MTEDDTFSSECEANATGIMHCLRMLADEAASLRLSRTLAALRDAIDACAAENVLQAVEGPAGERLQPGGRALVLH